MSVAPETLPASPTSAVMADGRRLYERGRFAEAFALFERLALDDEPEAAFWLATMLANGDGVAVNKAAALHHCRRAAELGNRAAQTNLGVMLVRGEGGRADAQTGLAWLMKAAEAGDTGAQFNTATILSAGKLVEKDLETAARYYEMAARSGYHPAQARLGYAYRHGFGVPRDLKKAFIWLSLAARHGVGTAISMLEGMMTEMSPDDLHAAQEVLDRFFESDDPLVSGARFRVQTH